MMFILASCISKKTTVVTLGYKTSARKVILPLAPSHQLYYFRGSIGENTVLMLNEDSVGFYVCNYWYFPNNTKLDTIYNHPATTLGSDTLFFSGNNRNSYWRHVETSRLNYGYFGIRQDQVAYYDSLITKIRFR
jgi:hypothetical protein